MKCSQSFDSAAHCKDLFILTIHGTRSQLFFASFRHSFSYVENVFSCAYVVGMYTTVSLCLCVCLTLLYSAVHVVFTVVLLWFQLTRCVKCV